MSAFGFLGFVVASINAVVNVANNINDNNNNRNNNNNDNNNNQINTNIANSGNEQTSMSMAMTGRGFRIMDTLRRARDRVWAQISGEDPNALTKEELKKQYEDNQKARRKQMEAEVLATMEKMYKEQQAKRAKEMEEEEEVSEYPKEIIAMLGRLYEESKSKQRHKRSEEDTLFHAIEEAKEEEKDGGNVSRKGQTYLHHISGNSCTFDSVVKNIFRRMC